MFNATEHLRNLEQNARKTPRWYLEVKWRLVWFREDHPDWSIFTDIHEFNSERAICRATIRDGAGLLMATAHKSETPAGFSDYLEKAETGAIGRALALCGYGTQFAPELEEGENRIVDAPVEKPKTPGWGEPWDGVSAPTPFQLYKLAAGAHVPLDDALQKKGKALAGLTADERLALGKWLAAKARDLGEPLRADREGGKNTGDAGDNSGETDDHDAASGTAP